MAWESPTNPTAPFRLVHIDDPALDKVPGQIMMEYEKQLDIRVLEAPNDALDWRGLASLDVQPTINTCLPLQAQYRTIAAPLAVGPGGRFLVEDRHLWTIYAYHTIGVENFFKDGQPFSVEFADEGKKRHVAIGMWEGVIPPDYYGWMATVIAHRGMRAANVPFSGAGGWRASRQLRAQVARRVLPTGPAALSIGNASESDIESDPPTA